MDGMSSGTPREELLRLEFDDMVGSAVGSTGVVIIASLGWASCGIMAGDIEGIGSILGAGHWGLSLIDCSCKLSVSIFSTRTEVTFPTSICVMVLSSSSLKPALDTDFAGVEF